MTAQQLRVDERGRLKAPAVPALAAPSHLNRWLHVSGLCRFVDAEDCVIALLALFAPWGADAVRVAGFEADDSPPFSERRRRDQGKQSNGWAAVRFPDGAAAASAAALCSSSPSPRLFGYAISAATSRAVRGLGDADAAATAAAAAAEAARLEAQRAHNARQRQRAALRAVDALARLLAALPPPGADLLPRGGAPALLGPAAAREPPLAWSAVPPAARPDAVLQARVAPHDPASAAAASPVLCFGPPPSRGEGDAPGARLGRKRLQLASFELLLRALVRCARAAAADGRGLVAAADGCTAARPPLLTVVDFGCGTGGLLLPLACLFPDCDFVGVDCNPTSVAILRDRAAACGPGAARNVSALACRIEAYRQSGGPRFDVGLALHACGGATDAALAACTAARAAFAVSPCCLGKMALPQGGGDGNGQPQPRSAWLRGALKEAGADGAAFARLARAADVSSAPRGRGHAAAAAAGDAAGGGHDGSGSDGDGDGDGDGDRPAAGADEAAGVRVRRAAAEALLRDRGCAAAERGYAVQPLRLLRPGAQAKNLLLAGVPTGEGERPGWARALRVLADPDGVG